APAHPHELAALPARGGPEGGHRHPRRRLGVELGDRPPHIPFWAVNVAVLCTLAAQNVTGRRFWAVNVAVLCTLAAQNVTGRRFWAVNVAVLCTLAAQNGERGEGGGGGGDEGGVGEADGPQAADHEVLQRGQVGDPAVSDGRLDAGRVHVAAGGEAPVRQEEEGEVRGRSLPVLHRPSLRA